MLTIRVWGRTASRISSITSGRKIGLTAKNKISAWAAACALPSVIRIENRSLTRFLVSSVLAKPRISSALTTPFCSIPPIIADAIFPKPINPIFLSFTVTVSSLTFPAHRALRSMSLAFSMSLTFYAPYVL